VSWADPLARTGSPRAISQRPLLRALARHSLELVLAKRAPGRGRRTSAPILHREARKTPRLPVIGPSVGSARNADITALIYELLDAHDDTARLVASDSCAADWAAHADYLRALQRTGREILARLGAP
jgi:hypothetical protein